jgi:hypothetical protein
MSPTAPPPTLPTTPSAPPSTMGVEHYHIFHADAHVLSGELKRPIAQMIEPQIPVHIKDRRGGHLTRLSEDFSVEGFISYKRGLTRVSGSPASKARPGQTHVGWTTLSTSILEGLNVFEVITADRVVSQVSTDHDYENGRVPHVTFLGTQFSNFRVGGFAATVILNLGVVGKKPEDDLLYTTNTTFLGEVAKQNRAILTEPGLPHEVRKRYEDSLCEAESLLALSPGDRRNRESRILFSLVREIKIDKDPNTNDYVIPDLKIVGGNVLLIPEFGAAALGEVEVTIKEEKEREFYEPALNGAASAMGPYLSTSFEVTMLRMNLGCIGAGALNAGSSKSNGSTRP